jgi:carboxypeptidase family protein
VFLRTANCCVLVLVTVLSAAAQPKSVAAATSSDFQINGVLVDSNTGQPIPRARVAIAPVTQRDSFTTVITHEDGRFSFENLAPGKYTLTAQARGYLLQSFNQHDQFSSSIVVGPELDSSNLLFRLSPEGAISGVVSDEAGEPVRRAQVMLYLTGLSAGTEATRTRGRMMTNDEGAYHFGHLPPGRYLVAVTARPWYAQNQSIGYMNVSPAGGTVGSQPANPQLDVAYPLTFFPGVTDAGAATPIVLGRGEKAAADITLQPVPGVHLRLNQDKSDPERPTRISFEKRVLDGPPIQISVSVNNGDQQKEQEISGLPPGHYTLRTFFAGQGSPTEAAPSREIDVGSNGEIDNSQAGGYVPVTAKLQVDAGASIGQAWLQLLNKKSREVFSERIGNEGEVTFRQGLSSGSYEVSLSSSSGIFLKGISAAGASVIGRTIEIRPGNAVRLVVTAATGQGRVTGTALRQGQPFAGAMIVLVPADPAHNQVLFRRDQSDSDGTFTLANVVPGAYTLLAIEDGWELEWMKPAVLKNYMGAGVPVQVEANGKYDIKAPVQ